MNFEVVTSYARRHWDEYAHRCVETFDKHWSGMRLTQLLDEDLEARSTWLPAFKARHAWRSTSNYRFDAVRFAHKVAAIEIALQDAQSECLIWMDADCVSHQPVEPEWLAGLLGDADFAYLKRARKYPECGFMILHRDGRALSFWNAVVDLYVSDRLFDLAEWHDSFAIEHVRAIKESAGLLRCVSLSGEAESTGHPLVNGPLGARLDHLKGKRKQAGKSMKADLVKPRNESYWSA